jgi:hypothetical protein
MAAVTLVELKQKTGEGGFGEGTIPSPTPQEPSCL